MEPKPITSVRPNHQKRVPIQNVMSGEKMYKLSTFTDQIEAKPGDTIKGRVPKRVGKAMNASSRNLYV